MQREREREQREREREEPVVSHPQPSTTSSPVAASEHTLHTSQESLHEKLQLLGMPTSRHQFCVAGPNPHGQFIEFLLSSERLLRALGVESRVDHGGSPMLLAKALLTSLAPFVAAETLAAVTPTKVRVLRGLREAICNRLVSNPLT